jgi:hypothetical protein
MAPDRWYLTGFLIPFQAPEEVRHDAQSGDEADEVGDDGDNDDAATPEQGSARKAYFPSSIGASVLVGAGTQFIEITVSWGDYHPVEEPEAAVEEAPRPRRARDVSWKRTPREASLALDLGSLGAAPSSQDVAGSEGLRIVTMLRAVPPGTRRHLEGARALSIFLVNDRTLTKEKAESFVFQAQMSLRCREGFLPRPSARAGKALDQDEQIAELQYRDDCEYAVGHGASTHAELETSPPSPLSLTGEGEPGDRLPDPPSPARAYVGPQVRFAA